MRQHESALEPIVKFCFRKFFCEEARENPEKER